MFRDDVVQYNAAPRRRRCRQISCSGNPVWDHLMLTAVQAFYTLNNNGAIPCTADLRTATV